MSDSFSLYNELLVYVAGVEIPCESVSISFGQFNFPQFSVSIPYDPVMIRIGADDRLPVAVFHKREREEGFKLLVEGEITAVGVQKSGQSSSISLTCIDPLSILTQLFLYFISDIEPALDATAQVKQTQAAGNVIGVNQLPLAFFYELTDDNKGKPIERPIDILLNMFKKVMGYSPTSVGDAAAVQSFADSIRRLEKKQGITNTVTTTVDISKSVLGIVNTAVASSRPNAAGPREFSSLGLLLHSLQKNNIQIPAENSQSIEAVYNYLIQSKQARTIDAATAEKTPGVIAFDSKFSTAAISAGGSSVVEVINNPINIPLGAASTPSNDQQAFEKAHYYIAKWHESRHEAGLVHKDSDGYGNPVGISVGLIQHNQKSGTLYDIVMEMRSKNPAKFDETMGGDQGLEVFNKGKKHFQYFPFYNNYNYWKQRFSKLFIDNEDVQRDFDKRFYYNPARAIAKEYGLDNEMGVAVLFDGYIQLGPRTVRRLLNTAKATVTDSNDKLSVLKEFARLGDRYGLPPTRRPYNRRERMTRSGKFSFNSTFTSTSTTTTTPTTNTTKRVETGVRKVPFQHSGRSLSKFLIIERAEKVQESTAASAAFDYLKRTTNKTTGFTEEEIKQAYTKVGDSKIQSPPPTQTQNAQATTNSQFNRTLISETFFQRFFEKHKLYDKCVASPIIEERPGIFPVLGAMSSENTAVALASYSQSGGTRSGSMWDFIRQIFMVALWDLGFIVAPPALYLDSKNVPSFSPGAGKRLGIGSYFSRPQSAFGIPPKCNVFFPNMVESVGFEENYIVQPTRTYADDSTPAKVLGIPEQSVFSYFSSVKAAYPPLADRAIHNEAKKNKNNKDLVVFPEELYKGPVNNRVSAPTWFYFLFKELIDTAKREAQSQQGNTVTDTKTVQADGSVTYNKSGRKANLPFQDDSVDAEALKKASFVQRGYYRGQPTAFKAVNYKGVVMHEKAAESLIELNKQAKEQGIDIVVSAGYLTALQQLDGAEKKKVRDVGLGYAMAQAGAELHLSIPAKDSEKTSAWLSNNARKYGFMYDPTVKSLVSYEAQKSLESNKVSFQESAEQGALILPAPLSSYIFKEIQRVKALDPKNSLTKIYYDYCKNEHFREKYSSRTAAVTSVFNPYVIAGLPTYVFSNDNDVFHLAGVITSGSHQISNGGMATTSVQISHVRTFTEMFELINIEREGLLVAPMDPIEPVKNVFQNLPEAEKYYQQALGVGAADYRHILGFLNDGNAPPTIITESNAHQGFEREIGYLPEAKKYEEQANLMESLSYIKRPVCTIENYIDFHKGVRRLASMPSDKISGDKGTESRFYYEILDYSFTPGFSDSNNPTIEGLSKEEIAERTKKLPKTIRDWRSILLEYRTRVYR